MRANSKFKSTVMLSQWIHWQYGHR